MNIKHLLENNDLIYIDTATLMNTESLKRFLEHYEKVFCECKKQILVPESVCQELIRHINSKDVTKSSKAINALSLIRAYNNVFSIEDSNLTTEEIRRAFADQDLLVRLAQGLRYNRQLLITNDRGLSQDALDLNDLVSCKGKHVSVCFLTYSGTLSSGTYQNNADNISNVTTASKEPNGDSKEVTRNADERSRSPWGYIVASVAAFSLGIAINKYGKVIIGGIKTML
jgi:rRNA-processing protein FCF1